MKVVSVFLTFSLIFAPAFTFYNGYGQYPFSLPYVVVLKNSDTANNRFCTGSLISYNYVLTAANCTHHSGNSLEILAGVYNLSDTQEPTIVYRNPKNIITHPKWNATSGANDIALIELNESMPHFTYIKPIKLGDSNQTEVNLLGKTGFSAGFGITFNEMSTTGYWDIISRIDTPFINKQECLEGSRHYNKTFNENILCSDRQRGNICLGDFGAPLVWKEELIGVASYGGYGGCGTIYQNVFTAVAAYLEWIKNNSDVNY